MAWTQADADSIKAAILALVNGQRVVSVTFGNRTVTKQEGDLKSLSALLVMIEAELGATATGYNYRLAATRKGT